jgi:hypothetical protein
LVQKTLQNALLPHQDLPNGGFMCLIPRFDPVFDMRREGLKY